VSGVPGAGVKWAEWARGEQAPPAERIASPGAWGERAPAGRAPRPPAERMAPRPAAARIRPPPSVMEKGSYWPLFHHAHENRGVVGQSTPL